MSLVAAQSGQVHGAGGEDDGGGEPGGDAQGLPEDEGECGVAGVERGAAGHGVEQLLQSASVPAVPGESA